MPLINFKIHLELTFILNQGTNIYELLSGLSQKVKRLFVNAYFIAVNVASNEAAIKKEIILHKGRLKIMKIYDQSIDDLIKGYDEVRKVSTWKR